MPSDAWLGVHVGLDLGNRCRFGPDLHWVDTLDYDVDASRIDSFYASIRRYDPALRDGALQPDYTGIRPKICGPGDRHRREREADRGIGDDQQSGARQMEAEAPGPQQVDASGQPHIKLLSHQ